MSNNSKKKTIIIAIISAVAAVAAVTVAVITYIKLKANKVNKALFEASEYIAFDDEDVEDMLGAANISKPFDDSDNLFDEDLTQNEFIMDNNVDETPIEITFDEEEDREDN